jgi:crossover junction endodeoxyribonuclease RuvC
MIILGIDPGTRFIGYGIIQTSGSNLKYITCGVIKAIGSQQKYLAELKALHSNSTAEVSVLANRLLVSYQQLIKIIKQYQPDEIAIETVFYSQDIQATVKIGESRGIALLAAATTKTPIYEYAPTEVKKSVTGNGRADKSQVAEMVKHILALTEIPKPQDVTDALAIAVCHSHRML